MQKVPFTPQGIADKFVELYEFGDEELILEARAISFNFKLWVKDNFILNVRQEQELEQTPLSVQMYWSHLLATVLLGRHSVEMPVYEENPTGPQTLSIISSLTMHFTPPSEHHPVQVNFTGGLQLRVTNPVNS